MSTKKKSRVWIYFEENENQKSAICKLCKKILSVKNFKILILYKK